MLVLIKIKYLNSADLLEVCCRLDVNFDLLLYSLEQDKAVIYYTVEYDGNLHDSLDTFGKEGFNKWVSISYSRQ